MHHLTPTMRHLVPNYPKLAGPMWARYSTVPPCRHPLILAPWGHALLRHQPIATPRECVARLVHAPIPALHWTRASCLVRVATLATPSPIHQCWVYRCPFYLLFFIFTTSSYLHMWFVAQYWFYHRPFVFYLRIDACTSLQLSIWDVCTWWDPLQHYHSPQPPTAQRFLPIGVSYYPNAFLVALLWGSLLPSLAPSAACSGPSPFSPPVFSPEGRRGREPPSL
jgi:hypothetical protein